LELNDDRRLSTSITSSFGNPTSDFSLSFLTATVAKLSFPVVPGTVFLADPGSVSESAVIVPGSASTVPVSGVTVHLFP